MRVPARNLAVLHVAGAGIPGQSNVQTSAPASPTYASASTRLLPVVDVPRRLSNAPTQARAPLERISRTGMIVV